MSVPPVVPMPTYFVPHGAGPCFFMDWNPPTAWDPTERFLRGIAGQLPSAPRAILVVSGHWLEDDFRVTTAPAPSLIFDYFGFPPHTYALTYAAPGDPALAGQVIELLLGNDLMATGDAERGFDHGVFVPLKVMFPEARIPVIQLSLRTDMDPAAHLAAGRALAPLREQGVLIVGSGMSFHNMRGYGDRRFGPVSDRFDHWLTEAVESAPAARHAALVDWANGPSARLCHPVGAEEHFLPLLVAAGAAAGDAGRKVFSDRVMETTLSAFRFG